MDDNGIGLGLWCCCYCFATVRRVRRVRRCSCALCVCVTKLSYIKYYIMFMPPSCLFSLFGFRFFFFLSSLSTPIARDVLVIVFGSKPYRTFSLLIFYKRTSARQQNHIDKHELCMPSIDNFCLQNHNKIKVRRTRVAAWAARAARAARAVRATAPERKKFGNIEKWTWKRRWTVR